MNKDTIFNLVDSLSGLPRLSIADIPGYVMDSLNAWARPLAASIKITGPDKKTLYGSIGEQDLLDMMGDLEKRFTAVGISFALFSLDDSSGRLVAVTSIKSPTGHNGSILIMIKPENPLRHHIAEILRIYADQIVLSLITGHSITAIKIEEILRKHAAEIFRLGVDGILVSSAKSLSHSYWIDIHTKVPIVFEIGEQLQDILKKPQKTIDIQKTLAAGTLLPGKDTFDTVVWDYFTVSGNGLVALFAGKFSNPEPIFAQFRMILSSAVMPIGYEDIAISFKQLIADHNKIIKAEKVASILETAVTINHEINNPLTAILGNTQLLLLDKDKLPKDLLAKITTIEKSALRIRQVTQKLMAVIEPITTPYIDGLQMLDIDKSSEQE
jgi:hypothetical protein